MLVCQLVVSVSVQVWSLGFHGTAPCYFEKILSCGGHPDPLALSIFLLDLIAVVGDTLPVKLTM